MNSSAGLIGATADQAAQVISSWGFTVTPDMLTQIAQSVGENSILSRTGGAPTLAVGMASILSSFLGGSAMMGIWYHFIILFEALFILTTVDAGTRVLRFMIQDFVGAAIPAFRDDQIVDQQPDRLGASLRAVGLPALRRRRRSLRRHLDDVAAVRRHQPDAGGDRAHPLHGDPVQDEARALRLRHRSSRACGCWFAPSPRGWRRCSTPTRRSASSATRSKFSAAAAAGTVLAPAKHGRPNEPRRLQRLSRRGLAGLSVAIVLVVVVYAIIDIRKALGSPTSTAVEVGGATLAAAE